MTKTANKRAIRALPALRASLLWYKRKTIRDLRKLAKCASSSKVAEHYYRKATKVARTELADLRAWYLLERTSEIRQAPLFELARVVPGLVRL